MKYPSRFEFHHGFASRNLDNHRTITVWLPPDYDQSDRLFPVLYMQDGQNLFDRKRAPYGSIWEADRIADRLVSNQQLQPIILVAIDNTIHRDDEYTLFRDDREQKGGQSRLYGKFITEELKPFIDSHYRTKMERESTGVAGSSLGGLVSLTLAMDYPEVFGLCAGISPSLWWANQRVLYEILSHADRLTGSRLWFDMGTEEGHYPHAYHPPYALTRSLARRLEQVGLMPGWDYYYQEIVGGNHHENDWRDRFDQVLMFLFGKSIQ